MLQLPTEIIEQILTYSDIDIDDVQNLAQTSTSLHAMISNNNRIWKSVYKKTYPQYVQYLTETPISWHAEVNYVYNLRFTILDLIAEMPTKYYKRYELSETDFSIWNQMLEDHEASYYYLVTELMSIVNNNSKITGLDVVPITTPGNLTLRFYAMKVLRYVRQKTLEVEWQKYMELPKEKQLLEIGAVILAQWCQPNLEITYEGICEKIDRIVESVFDSVRSVWPNHPLLKLTRSEMEIWRQQKLSKSHWNYEDTSKLIGVLSNTLSRQLGFISNNECLERSENSYINNVIDRKRGSPVTVGVLYEAIARRVGVFLEPITLPPHFLLRWKWGPAEHEISYINLYNKFRSISARVTRDHPTRGIPRSARQVMARMANGLEFPGRQHVQPNGRIAKLRSTLELQRLIDPTDLNCLLHLARLYILYNMDVRELIEYLRNNEDFDTNLQPQAQHILHLLLAHERRHGTDVRINNPRVEVAPRTKELKYAVGMVMRHLKLSYTCVIYDWDPLCLASRDWQQTMHVYTLELQDKQPFYNVLVEDGSHRYVAQENLLPVADPRTLPEAEDIGSHFSHFCETHFVPNEEKEREYPEDAEVRHTYHNKLMFGFK